MVPADDITVNVNEYPRVRENSQMVASMIHVDKTYDSYRQAQRIWNVRRKLILGIWLMLLPVLASVEVFTVARHAWIKNKFESFIVL